MKSKSLLFPKQICFLSWALLAVGCRSPNVNPASPQPQVGYVDLYAEAPADLSWSVHELREERKDSTKIFYDLDPLPGRILRLAFPPGSHRLSITFLNRVINKPADVDVEVREGKITPVRVTLAENGTTFVQTKQSSVGGTAYGRYGRRTKIGAYEASMFAVSARVDAPVEYQVKERMPYGK